MDTKALKQKILDLAIHGRLVPQDPNDEPASILLQRIRDEKERLIKEGKIKKGKKTEVPAQTEDAPFEVPEGWVWCKLGTVSKIARGGSPRPIKNFLTTDINGVNWIKIGDTDKNCKYINSVKEKIRPEGVSKSRMVYKGDFLLTNSMSFGRPYILNVDGCIHDGWLVISPIGKAYTTDFLYYLLSSSFAYSQFAHVASGGVVTNLNSDKVADSVFPLPPLAEQHRIVAEIERWFGLIDFIENGKTGLKSAVKQAKAKILDLAIHGRLVPQDPNDEPASTLLQRINPKAEIVEDNDEYGDVPEGWCVTRLGEICTFLSRGKSPKYKDEDRTYPVFAQKCNLKDGGISLEQARFLDPMTVGNWGEEYKLRNGDVLINSTGTGTVGRTRLFSESCLGHYPFVVPDSHVSVVRTHQDVDSTFIYSYISSNLAQQYFEDNLAGSTNQKELYIGVLNEMKVPLPPLAEQHRIVAKIEELFVLLDKIESSL